MTICLTSLCVNFPKSVVAHLVHETVEEGGWPLFVNPKLSLWGVVIGLFYVSSSVCTATNTNHPQKLIDIWKRSMLSLITVAIILNGISASLWIQFACAFWSNLKLQLRIKRILNTIYTPILLSPNSLMNFNSMKPLTIWEVKNDIEWENPVNSIHPLLIILIQTFLKFLAPKSYHQRNTQ